MLTSSPSSTVGTAAGLPALHDFINTFTARVYKPGYSDWATVINAGSTDAWGKIITTLAFSLRSGLTLLRSRSVLFLPVSLSRCSPTDSVVALTVPPGPPVSVPSL
jgi:hypothetical protein